MPKRAVFVVLCTFVTVGLAACGRATPGPTTVLIVRHGEKVSQDADTPLSDAGRARAVALADATSDAGVSAIYVSQFARNKDTARPLAERAGLAVSERPVNLSDPGDYGKRLAAEILEQQAGRTVVVVGHQNTIPLIVECLTGRGAVPLGDAEYDRLTIVTIPPAGDAHVIVARYGAPSGT